MESDDGFDAIGKEIASDPIRVLLAEWRRDAFIARLKTLPDVIEVIPTGSLARDTCPEDIKDIDLIVVFEKSAHPDYDSGSKSAEDALTYLQEKLVELLHPLSGPDALINGTEQRTHVVQCHGGWTGPYAGIISSAPPVDVMPAVRKQPHLLAKSYLRVPKLARDGSGKVIPGKSKWEDVDPETFMRQVEQRQREWKYFTEVIRLVKAWAEQEGLEMKSVAIEAMVLKYCPRPRMFQTLSRGEAIARFFEAANKDRITSLKDPAGRCGEIDRRMDFGKLRRKLKDAAGLARQAMDAEFKWRDRRHLMQDATHPDVFWRRLFGRKYPEAREPFWRAPTWEPWSDGSWKPPPSNPNGPDNPNPNGPDDLNPNGPDDLNPNGPDDLNPPPGGCPKPPSGGVPNPSERPGPASDEPGTNVWTGVFGPVAATVSVPLTFG
jgi:hypothetical protein